MMTGRIRSAVADRPFRPFALLLTDGESIAVLHRVNISVSPGGRVVIDEGEGTVSAP
jgi:hypothetical protein